MRLLIVGPLVLSVLSWVHMWLIGSASTTRRLIAWIVAACLLLPAQIFYNVASGQAAFLINNIVTGWLLARGWRQARTDRHRELTPAT